MPARCLRCRADKAKHARHLVRRRICGHGANAPLPALRLAIMELTKPKLPARNPRPLDQRLQLGPGDLRMRAAAEAAIGSRHDVFPAEALGETHQTLRD